MKKNKKQHDTQYNKYSLDYIPTKQLGIYYTKKLLKDYGEESKIELLKNCDKEDDLCDAFLHAYKKF